MQNIIQEFLDTMHNCGVTPHSALDIKGDDTRRNFRLSDDKASKKSGFYKLKIEGDFGYGYFGNYKTDEYFSFSSKSSKIYSKDEIATFKRKSEEAKKDEINRRNKEYEIKSNEVSNFLFFLEKANSDHPYLKKKKLPSNFGALHSGSYLIIPMMNFEGRWNYQRINEDGSEKKYYNGARKSGTWFPIQGDAEKDTVYIAEGFATAATVNLATSCTVLVAFDTSNLKNVVDAVKNEYKNSKIIIAADNDHETKVNGKPYNAGLLCAEKIKLIYPDVKIVYPEFKNGKGLSDFNDLYVHEGLKEVMYQLGVARRGNSDPVSVEKEKSIPAIVENPDAWRERIITNKNGIVATSTFNARIVLENAENLSGVFKYNEFSKHVILHKCPPWENESEFKVRNVADFDYIRLECYLEEQWGLRIAKHKCADLIETVAMLKKNSFNPAKIYFENLKWDGVPRLDDWLKKYVSDGTQSDQYLTLVGRKFLCGLAARAMYPGIKFDTMIIFEGEQYAGKSFLSKIMATAHGEEYFLDDFKDIENKDALMKMQGKLVVEFPEISTLRKAEVNDLKAFISRQTDEYRPPYGRNVLVSQRQCVFIGTVNPEGAYFKDMTGNRRYWPIACRKKLELAKLKEIMPQLHAEAATLVMSGEQLWLSAEEYAIAQNEQNKRVVSDLWIDRIEDIVSGHESITTDHILTELGIKTEQRNNMVFMRLQQVMASIGWKSARVRIGTKRKRGFISGDALLQTEFEEEIKW